LKLIKKRSIFAQQIVLRSDVLYIVMTAVVVMVRMVALVANHALELGSTIAFAHHGRGNYETN
jgi:hypothetical protein